MHPNGRDDAAGAADALRAAGHAPGGRLGLVVVSTGLALAHAGTALTVPAGDGPARAAAVRVLEEQLRPRWTWWSAHVEAPSLIAAGVHLGACWDLAAVHRVLDGGWRDDPATVWAWCRGLDPDRAPTSGQLDLLTGFSGDDGVPDEPVRPDGYLRPDWADSSWRDDPSSRCLAFAARWAALSLVVAEVQQGALDRLAADDRTPAMLTARAESVAELLCVELGTQGLPVDRGAAAESIAQHVGLRPAGPAEAAEQNARRDERVLSLLPDPTGVDLRNPASVLRALRAVGLDVPDTRSWRLERLAHAHPVVPALLAWRTAERIGTTYGYGWLDAHVGADGRLRGAWRGSDGAAGRMTARAGLHNMPTQMRTAVAAEPGHVLVRADLGQVEPRVLAAISRDPALVRATADDDLYLPVAERIGVDRPTAKVAVLAAMYGQTSGAAGRALRGMDRAYPTAMGFLRAADAEGRAGRPVRTYGGRLVRVGSPPAGGWDAATAAARGRFARNAVVQGAAAELFKAWAATVRAGLTALPDTGRIVLCLHDELLVHVPTGSTDEVQRLLHDALDQAAARWAPDSGVRFVADVVAVARWSDAKG